jgi:hypothetical protein
MKSREFETNFKLLKFRFFGTKKWVLVVQIWGKPSRPQMEDAQVLEGTVTCHHMLTVKGGWNLGQTQLDEHDLIGEGQVACVYSAVCQGREVAVKVIKPKHKNNRNIITAFERETEFSMACKHENVVKAVGFDKLAKALCMGKAVLTVH